MRILVITSHYPPAVTGGYERECAAAVGHLRREHEVVVLTSRHSRRLSPAEPNLRRALPILPGGWRGSLIAPAVARRTAKLVEGTIEEVDPDLIYFWNGAQLPLAGMVAASRSGVPLAYRVCEHWFGSISQHDQFARHLAPGDRGLRLAWAQLIRLINRDPHLRLDRVEQHPATIAWNSRYLKAATAIPPKVAPLLEEVIYPALPQGDRFAALIRKPTARPTILFLGRVAREKGIHLAYRALARLREQHRFDATLVVAGPATGAVLTELDHLARQLRVVDHVDYRGELDSDGIAAVLAGAHAVVVPSIWQEPAGLVCVEAALARAPIVASRSGGIAELVRDRRDGLLFEIGDSEGCADLLAETLTDPASTRTRVESAYERARGLSFQPYVEATDRFLGQTMRAFSAADQ
jgi:glycosyltransferase involved in cell wall biosynthesis